MTQKNIILTDADGQSPRLRWVALFSANDWAKMQPVLEEAMGSEVVRLVERLPHMVDHSGNETLGWWLPRAFEAKQQINQVPMHTPTSSEGLGLGVAVDLSKHKKALFALCEAHPELSKLGEDRSYAKESNKTKEDRWQIKPWDPFEGISGAKRMLEPGALIENENLDSLLETQATVIYSPSYDAYLDVQLGPCPLNKARVFSNPAEAEEVIQRRHLQGCITATLSMRVEGFSKPLEVGPKVRAAWTGREADNLSQATAPAETARSTPRPRF